MVGKEEKEERALLAKKHLRVSIAVLIGIVFVLRTISFYSAAVSEVAFGELENPFRSSQIFLIFLLVLVAFVTLVSILFEAFLCFFIAKIVRPKHSIGLLESLQWMLIGYIPYLSIKIGMSLYGFDDASLSGVLWVLVQVIPFVVYSFFLWKKAKASAVASFMFLLILTALLYIASFI